MLKWEGDCTARGQARQGTCEQHADVGQVSYAVYASSQFFHGSVESALPLRTPDS